MDDFRGFTKLVGSVFIILVILAISILGGIGFVVYKVLSHFGIL